ncbi:M20 family metallopeptidase [Streptomyces aurantiacus]|uniref:Peptidase M20 n=1 Tax=Streptomyces aurantiacus TaxID=47760 RepID=A0A7G1PGV3_9ACTN|nr:M20 family metallopeptidase [Streptomyces aurantiacus]BCL33176.1 peptidase M20 [Streptomyces aurantiacus]
MDHVQRETETFGPAEAAELVELTQALIRIDTVNPPGNERAVAQLLLDRALEWGLEGEIVELSEARANLQLRLPGGTEQPALMYCGHFDTVPLGGAPWTHDAHGAHLSPEGVLWGRGAVDMKGGVAAMVCGMGALARRSAQFPAEIRFLGTIGEEVDCAGARAALGSGAMDGVGRLVIAEPTNMELVVAHKGALFLELTARGRSAHAAMPEQGVNAISHMMRLLERIEQLDFRVGEHPLLGRPTVTIGTITGGSVVNIVPDRCVAQVDIRTTPDVDHEALLEVLAHVVDAHRVDGVEFELRVTGDYPPVGTAPDDPLVTAADRVLRAFGDGAPRKTAVSYFSDGSILQPPTGLPTLLCGPGDPDLAHQTDERVDVAQLVRAARFFAELPYEVFQ